MMFREMRRSKQLLPIEDTIAVMERCTTGTMACLGDDDYPYSVPLNYVYYNSRIYFHSGKAGHKIDAIIKNNKVSFSVIDEEKIISEEYTTYFRSVIAFGKARIVDGEESQDAFMALVEKYSGNQPEEEKQKTISGCTHAYIIVIDVEHITGKQAVELIKA